MESLRLQVVPQVGRPLPVPPARWADDEGRLFRPARAPPVVGESAGSKRAGDPVFVPVRVRVVHGRALVDDVPIRP